METENLIAPATGTGSVDYTEIADTRYSMDVVYVDSVSGETGTAWPIGTRARPSSGVWASVVAIAAQFDTDKITLLNGTLTVGADAEGLSFLGNAWNDPNMAFTDNVIDISSYTLTACTFELISIRDSVGGGGLAECGPFERCSWIVVDTLTDCLMFNWCFVIATTLTRCESFKDTAVTAAAMDTCQAFENCFLRVDTLVDCSLFGTCIFFQLTGTTLTDCSLFDNCSFYSCSFVGCYDFDECVLIGATTLDQTGVPLDSVISKLSGDAITISNLTSGLQLTISGVGSVTIAASCTAGTINLHGDLAVTDSNGGATVNNCSTRQYGDTIYYDDILGTAGTVWPIGTARRPVDNLADALTIMAAENIQKLEVVGSTGVALTIDVNCAFTLIGNGRLALTISNGVIVTLGGDVDCMFLAVDVNASITINGNLRTPSGLTNADGAALNLFGNAEIGSGLLNGTGGIFVSGDCYVDGNVVNTTGIINVAGIYTINGSLITEGNVTGNPLRLSGTGTLDFNSAAGAVAVRNLQMLTHIDIANMTALCSLYVFADNGAIVDILASCIGGTIYVIGNAAVLDGAGGVVTVINHQIPTANSVDNFRPADVIGNKTDTAITAKDDVSSAMRYLKGLMDAQGRQLVTLDFWSLPQEEVQVTNVAGDKTLPDITIAGIPSGAVIIKAAVMFKARALENTNAAANKLNGAQEIQIRDDSPGAWVDAINFLDDMFSIAPSTREGVGVFIGSIDVSATVLGNDTYNLQWDEAVADVANLQFNDAQVGIRIWYSI